MKVVIQDVSDLHTQVLAEGLIVHLGRMGVEATVENEAPKPATFSARIADPLPAAAPQKARKYVRRSAPTPAKSEAAPNKRAFIREILNGGPILLNAIAKACEKRPDITRNYITTALMQMSKEGMVELSDAGLWMLRK